MTTGMALCATMGIAVMACAPTEEVVTETNPVDPSELDDTAPAETPYDETLSYHDRYGQTVNHSTDRYRFDVAAYRSEAERADAEVLYPSHAAFIAAHPGAIPSVQTLGTYFKQLDDTIYAGVEMAVQQGLAPTLQPKRLILTGALDYLGSHRSSAGDEAIAQLAAALRLGGTTPSFPAELSAAVDSAQDDFLAHPEEAKPFGFYTWSAELQQIWQQDRLLQRPLPSAASSCALAEAIAVDTDRTARYHQLVQLYSRLTNPLHSSLEDMLVVAGTSACITLGRQAFLSTSRTPEVELFNELYPNGVPPDADLMADLVKAIRDGSVDLSPQPDDGWYQHQLYALETLLVTDRSEERGKIAFMARYKKRLQEAFSTMLVQHRETHAKQADVAGDLAAGPPPGPDFRLEPLATVYLRHARAYVFLEQALDAVLGPEVLDGALVVGAEGAGADTVRQRIQHAAELMFGLYILSSQDVGLRFGLEQPGDPGAAHWDALAAAADQWLLGLPHDPVAGSDVRVIVPIARLSNGATKYWAVIGVRATVAGYSLIHGMDVSPPPPDEQRRVWLPTEQFLEVVSSSTPLTRTEFRELCDAAGSAEAIQAALEAR